ncbi:hypothetical protein POSPLADRAFT_1143468 [Postia placenta MAD-698-R-SB12]|uniref:Uncharacterized protein n=1 Tax=Postia placenta MAD-698-R-SB12 TaxID=670580 RepID=A0A1X6N1F5_9APHY|nr:hypothetical protein POSPLADRAFT_1143468 [Postia placenta MAD-698-R-SB12]OSX62448.1 hypothetical protein POSPLADRAFT_1143468 [Postia placenta MAD-698-R-SB12]
MPVRDNHVQGFRPPATRAPELSSSFLTTRGCMFQHQLELLSRFEVKRQGTTKAGGIRLDLTKAMVSKAQT